jgi:hypothetical protein
MIDWGKVEAPPREYDTAFDAAYATSVAYLKDTDWHVIAMYERKRPIPEDIRSGRLEALDVVTAV